MCVTTFSDKGYEEYGKKMVKTFNQYWDQNIELMVFSDSHISLPSTRIHNFLLNDYPEIQAFTERHRDNPVAHGKQPTRFWQSKELKNYVFLLKVEIYASLRKQASWLIDSQKQ